MSQKPEESQPGAGAGLPAELVSDSPLENLPPDVLANIARYLTPAPDSAPTEVAPQDTGASAGAAAAAAATCVATENAELPLQSNAPRPEGTAPSHDEIKTLVRLSGTSSYLRSIFKPSLIHTMVVNGQEAQVRKMLEARLDGLGLLIERGTVTGPEGRVYKDVTAYELALRCGDTQMCEMMHEFFDQLKGGEDIRLEQFNRVFPGGDVDGVIGAQTTYNFDSLIEAIKAASEEDVNAQLTLKRTDTPLGEAFNTFRSDFTALSKQEQHANLKHLLEAFRAYAEDERIAAWEREGNYEKMDLFWRQVIGFVQLYLPECDKQAFHQGLYDVVENSACLSREADFKHDRGASLHRRGDMTGCGFDFASSCGNWRGCDARQLRLDAGCTESYVKQKHQTWKAYSAADKPHETRCDSMT